MSEEEIDKEVAWLISVIGAENLDRCVKLVETILKERDIYRSLLESANKKIERYRDLASCYFPAKEEDAEDDSESSTRPSI